MNRQQLASILRNEESRRELLLDYLYSFMPRNGMTKYGISLSLLKQLFGEPLSSELLENEGVLEYELAKKLKRPNSGYETWEEAAALICGYTVPSLQELKGGDTKRGTVLNAAEVSKKTGLPASDVKKLMRDNTLTEIYLGRWTEANGKWEFAPSRIIELDKERFISSHKQHAVPMIHH